uniref:Uncharacterized protein n=1 Tax=Physcomitrium patens TaxID=3218 RepID=A0A2K1KBZ1_PHYPA|nr:hypothetical protein PHYPA_010479 [Physcomitrium patens]
MTTRCVCGLFVILFLVSAFVSVGAQSHHQYNLRSQSFDESSDPLAASKLNVYATQQFPEELTMSHFPEGFIFGAAGSHVFAYLFR